MAVPAMPNRFVCPITQEVMFHPLMCKEGHNFEKAAIEEWLQAHSECPVGREPLTTQELSHNRALREEIQQSPWAAMAKAPPPAPTAAQAPGRDPDPGIAIPELTEYPGFDEAGLMQSAAAFVTKHASAAGDLRLTVGQVADAVKDCSGQSPPRPVAEDAASQVLQVWLRKNPSHAPTAAEASSSASQSSSPARSSSSTPLLGQPQPSASISHDVAAPGAPLAVLSAEFVRRSPVQLVMQQKASWSRGDAVIRTSDDEELFKMKGKATSLVKESRVLQDLQGTVLAQLKTDYNQLRLRQVILRADGTHVATVQRSKQRGTDRASVTIPGQPPLSIAGTPGGSFFAVDTEDGTRVACASTDRASLKNQFLEVERYTLTIASNVDVAFIVLVCASLDRMFNKCL